MIPDATRSYYVTLPVMTRTYSARAPKPDTHNENANVPPPRKRLALSKRKPAAPRSNQLSLTQLHFALDSSILRTCSLCALSYTKGAPDDEALHRSHCGRVQRGMEWGKEEERESLKASVDEVATSVKLRDGTKGRIICFPATVGGKIGTKVRS